MQQQAPIPSRCRQAAWQPRQLLRIMHTAPCPYARTRPLRNTSAASTSAPSAAAGPSTSSLAVPPPPGNPLLMAAVEALFSFPPFFSAASKNARNMIIKRAEALGIDWTGTMKELQALDWDALLKGVEDPALQYPSYYTKPFHAYPKGNLCWEAALEVTMAAKSVHAFVMDPNGKVADPEGDHMLRSNYSARMFECLSQLGKDPSTIRDVVDFGAATGLSSQELMRVLPASRVLAVDLSPHFLAVGKYQQQKREASSGRAEPLSFLHAAAEATGLPSSSQDLVSVCLVCHELPQAATKALLKEAFRLLRPGGALAIMEMDPTTAPFRRTLGNPFAYTAFKSTEPYLQEYMSLNMDEAIVAAGFGQPQQRNNTPRHKTVVAIKPQ